MIKEFLFNTKEIKNLINKDKYILSGNNDSLNILLISIDFINNDKSIFICLPNLFLAQKYYDELINILPENDVLFYPNDELAISELILSGGDFKYERINTIINLLDDNKKVIITNYNGAIKYQFSKNRWKSFNLKINKGENYSIDEICTSLKELGYNMVYTTTKTGEFSKRGSIIDIFPLNNENPIRLDFFGSELEEIRVFDIETQKSISKIDNILILPVVELIYNDTELERAIFNIEEFIKENKLNDAILERYSNDILSLSNRNNLDSLTRYIHFFDIQKNTIFEFKDNKKIYLIDLSKISDQANRINKDIEDYSLQSNDNTLLKLKYLDNYENLLNKYDVATQGLIEINKDIEDIYVKNIEDLKANPKAIMNEFYSNYKNNYVILLLNNNIRFEHLKESMLELGLYYCIIDDINNIKMGQINIIFNSYLPSLYLVNSNIKIYNEKTLFDIKYNQSKPKYKSIYKNTIKISKYDELQINDYVVHYDYGIGQYLGLKVLESNKLKRDYIHILYAKGDSLYIPLEQINSIQKLSNKEGSEIKLTTLGGSAWKKAKLKVKNKVHDISKELIELYSKRSISEGFSFEADSSMQLDFENDFMYELTKDQKKAIDDVKKDMRSIHPMDRLICGDVGYGKTEVALRAAFKAVLSGKQVCVLAPTTILSRQHYYTFKERMDRYAVKVELLNRFITTKKVNEIISKIKTGEIDILIGTHKILSDSIKFKDLGLLIVDEEQRFGVSHKEKIKSMKVNIDAITLSATPIPRTLQMSIIGIKDLSMIETPPKNRYPVQTYVLKRNESVIRDAIIRELSRGGQVFYLYNKVEDIEDIAFNIKGLVPDARICIGHGKMDKNDLENTLVKFIDKEYDVLVCTTIIETGLDIPDTNTIIIHDADKLGLSQLYQIRGRVGRSDRIAYAYLMFDPYKQLNDTAYKRLEALKEFSELGSGFKIAMRDLAIRGAGDILGSEQSGFIETVGLEMYLKILEDEIKEREGKLEEEKIKDISLNEVYTSRHIEDNYISNEDIKIEIHKKIDTLNSINDLELLKEELIDRFGVFNNDLDLYMNEKLFKNLCDKLDVCKIDNKNKNEMIIYISKEMTNNIDGNKMFNNSILFNEYIKLRYINEMIQIVFNKQGFKDQTYLIILNKYLNSIIE